MPFELKVQRTTELRCTNRRRVIRERAITVKTCYVNKPWVFCSRECYREFLAKWTAIKTPAPAGD